MKIYLAARYSQKEEIKQVAAILRIYGIETTSSWLEEPHPSDCTMDQFPDAYLSGLAIRDIDDIKSADAVILFTVDPLIPTVRGGRHVETGYALALGKPLYIIGPRENIFHYLPQVKPFETVRAFIEAFFDVGV